MTLVVSVDGLERFDELGRTRIRRLWPHTIDASLDEQTADLGSEAHAQFGTYDYYPLWFHLASPTYSPFVPYAGFGKVELDYSSIIREHEKGVEIFSSGKGVDSSQFLSYPFNEITFRMYDLLPMSWIWKMLYAELELDLQRYLRIKESESPNHATPPRLLPQLLL